MEVKGRFFKYLTVVRGEITSDGFCSDDEGKSIALILKDGDFWPMMAFVTPDEAAALARKLAVLAEAIRVGLTWR